MGVAVLAVGTAAAREYPTIKPTPLPTLAPSLSPTLMPTSLPTQSPTLQVRLNEERNVAPVFALVSFEYCSLLGGFLKEAAQ